MSGHSEGVKKETSSFLISPEVDAPGPQKPTTGVFDSWQVTEDLQSVSVRRLLSQMFQNASPVLQIWRVTWPGGGAQEPGVLCAKAEETAGAQRRSNTVQSTTTEAAHRLMHELQLWEALMHPSLWLLFLLKSKHAAISTEKCFTAAFSTEK